MAETNTDTEAITAVQSIFRGIARRTGIPWDAQNDQDVLKAVRLLEDAIVERSAGRIARQMIGAAASAVDPAARTDTSPHRAALNAASPAEPAQQQQAAQPATPPPSAAPPPRQGPTLRRITAQTGPTIQGGASAATLQQQYLEAVGRFQLYQSLKRRWRETQRIPIEAEVLGFDLADPSLEGALHVAMNKAQAAWRSATKPLRTEEAEEVPS
jgi:hypothetical protein